MLESSHCQGIFCLKAILSVYTIQLRFISLSFSHLITFCSTNDLQSIAMYELLHKTLSVVLLRLNYLNWWGKKKLWIISPIAGVVIRESKVKTSFFQTDPSSSFLVSGNYRIKIGKWPEDFIFLCFRYVKLTFQKDRDSVRGKWLNLESWVASRCLGLTP